MVRPRPVNVPEMGIEDGDVEADLDLSRLQSMSTMKRTTIQPVKDVIPIVACDASIVKVGETETGMLIANRAVAVWRSTDKLLFKRRGPLLFHVLNSDAQNDS